MFDKYNRVLRALAPKEYIITIHAIGLFSLAFPLALPCLRPLPPWCCLVCAQSLLLSVPFALSLRYTRSCAVKFLMC